MLTCAGRRNYLVRYFQDALAGKGRVYAADASPDAPAMQEADRAIVTPRVDEPAYIDFLLHLCRSNDIGMVVSLNDLELPVLAAAKARFADIGVVAVVSSPEVVDIAFDKWRTALFLESCGLHACQTHLTLADARRAIQEGRLAFPLVVKPRWGSASISVEVVRDRDELELAFRLTCQRVAQSFLAGASAADPTRCVMIQECLAGDEYGLDVVNDLQGNTVAVFAKKKLAMRAGETDRAITVENIALQETGWTIGRHLRHVGNLDCDVFLTPAGPQVLELNPRFGGGYPFSHVAGANVPAAILAWAENRAPDPGWLKVRPGVRAAKCDRIVLAGNAATGKAP